MNYSIIRCICALVIGVLLVAWPEAAILYLVITIGVLFLVPGGFFVIPVLVLIAGIVVLFNPFTAAAVPFIILGVSSIVYGLSDLINIIRFRQKKEPGMPEIEDITPIEEIKD